MARGQHQADRVLDHAVVDVDPVGQLLEGQQVGQAQHLVGVGRVDAHPVDDLDLLGRAGVPDDDLHQEAIALGLGRGSASFTGNNNIYIGAFAGFNVGTGNNNIAIGNRGVAGDKSTIRLGQQGTQNAIYIAGIAGVTAGDSHVCVVTSGANTGQLGVCNPANQPTGDVQTELQKQQSVVAAQQDVIKAQQQQINDLQQRLSRLESLIAKK